MYIYQTGQAVFLPAALATGVSPKLEDATIDRWFNTNAMTALPAFTRASHSVHVERSAEPKH